MKKFFIFLMLFLLVVCSACSETQNPSTSSASQSASLPGERTPDEQSSEESSEVILHDQQELEQSEIENPRTKSTGLLTNKANTLDAQEVHQGDCFLGFTVVDVRISVGEPEFGYVEFAGEITISGRLSLGDIFHFIPDDASLQVLPELAGIESRNFFKFYNEDSLCPILESRYTLGTIEEEQFIDCSITINGYQLNYSEGVGMVDYTTITVFNEIPVHQE